MTTLHYTVGLPGSGKTTWAREVIRLSAGPVVRTNRDDLRLMLHEGVYSVENEQVIRWMQEALIYAALERRMDVVVDDTNLNPLVVANLESIVRDLDPVFRHINIVEHSFLHVPLETCIERDAARPNPVGREVIEGMRAKFHLLWEKS